MPLYLHLFSSDCNVICQLSNSLVSTPEWCPHFQKSLLLIWPDQSIEVSLIQFVMQTRCLLETEWIGGLVGVDASPSFRCLGIP